MVKHQTGRKSTNAMTVGKQVEKIQISGIANSAKRKSSKPIRNALACEVSQDKHSHHGLKKAETLPPLETTLLEPEKPEAVQLELDEMWSFVYKKKRKRWKEPSATGKLNERLAASNQR